MELNLVPLENDAQVLIASALDQEQQIPDWLRPIVKVLVRDALAEAFRVANTRLAKA